MATPPIRRYALVPGPPEQRDETAKPIRRFHLARVAVSPRSALGEDRHERMEAVAAHDGHRRDAGDEARPSGSGPGAPGGSSASGRHRHAG
jgi:hypothetical protein